MINLQAPVARPLAPIHTPDRNGFCNVCGVPFPCWKASKR